MLHEEKNSQFQKNAYTSWLILIVNLTQPRIMRNYLEEVDL